MQLIKEFEYLNSKNSLPGDKTYSKGKIKTEVNSSQINFYNSEGDFIEMHWKKVALHSIKLFGYGNSNNVLSIKELEFLARIYDLKTIYDEEDIKVTLKHIHPDYFPGIMEFFEKDNKEYLVISFDRKSGLYAPQAPPDISYIHGIWEAPLLTDEIIAKIKQS